MCTTLKKPKHLSKSTGKGDDNKVNIFSMIKFYESIPDYETIRHLSCYEFLEQLNVLKTAHMNFANKCDSPNSKLLTRPKSTKCKRRRKSVQSKKCAATSIKSINHRANTVDNVKQKHVFDFSDYGVKSNSTPNSGHTINLSKSCGSIQEKLLFDYEPDEKLSNCVIPSPINRSPIIKDQHHHHHHHHDDRCHYSLYEDCLEDEIQDHLHYRHFLNQRRSDYKELPSRLPSASPIDSPNRMKIIENSTKYSNLNATRNHKIKRAKSCPKHWVSNYFPLSNEPLRCDDTDKLNEKKDESIKCHTPLNIEENITHEMKPRKNSATKIRSKLSVKQSICERKSPSSNSDEFIRENQMVRTNLAANLRQQWSRRKLMQMSTDRVNSVVCSIPKCHQWNVRKTPAWQSFNMEDTTTEKFVREMARKEEHRMRQQTHSIHMSRMRHRVKSAQLLLEGRALK